MAQPLPGVPPLAELFSEAQPPGKIEENSVIITRFAHWRDLRAHGNHKPVVTAAADILSLQRGGSRQNDVGEFGLRGPVLLMHHHRLRTAPGLAQSVNILVMMKRIASRPVDQTDVGIMQLLTVELIGFSRVQQHIGQPRHRDDAVHRILPGGQARAGKRFSHRARQVGTGIAKPEAAARRADLSQQRGQGHRRPVGLLP